MSKFPNKWKVISSDILFLLIIIFSTFSLGIIDTNVNSLFLYTSTIIVTWFIMSRLLNCYKHDISTLSSSRLLYNATMFMLAISLVPVLWRLPWEVCIFTAFSTFFYLVSTRTSYQYLKHRPLLKNVEAARKKLLIIGAGEAGQHVAERLRHKPEYEVVGFLDDDHRKIGMDVCSIPVLSEIKLVKSMVQRVDVEQILIAIPSLSKQKMQQMMKLCVNTGVHTQIIPSVHELVNGQPMMKQMRDVNIEDLLGREEVALDEQALAGEIAGQVVLVTGAGGSIGSEICRQLARLHPKQIVLVGHGENSIYLIEQMLKKMTTSEITPVIGDIQDKVTIQRIMLHYRPHIVYHAAAHKHVPLMEQNPMESIKNNIIGTKNVATAAHFAKVHRFVMISSDKAVDPPNVMGATKRVAEMIIQQIARTSQTKFAVVRFGNVLGSRGSVIPLFQQQIQQGGPITITDARMTRYFMTIPEAARLVLQASILTEGGEIFILDMGEPVKIIDLAKNLILLSGLELEDVPIVEIGMREGEKLHEVLIGEHEQVKRKVYNKIYVGQTQTCSEEALAQFLNTIFKLPSDEVKATLLAFANTRQFVAAERKDFSWKY